MNVVLRPATDGDASSVASILLTSRRTFLPYLPSPRSDDDVRRWMRDTVVPSGGVTVAVADASIVGFIATTREPAASWIRQLFLVPTHVGRGIGARLLADALLRLPDPVRLYAFQANLRARSFYELHGFRTIELTDGRTNEEQWPDVLYELDRRGGRVS